MPKRVYLDTNVYCRPLDDQMDSRIHAEAEAFLQIADNAERRKTEIVSSDYVKFEIEQIKDPLKRKSIRGFERVLSKTNVTSSKRLITIAKEIKAKCKLNSLDALHSAAACIGKANFLLTCDDEILDNARRRVDCFWGVRFLQANDGWSPCSLTLFLLIQRPP